MVRLIAGLALLGWAGFAHASRITLHTDTGLPGATVDGIIAADEYGPGNLYAFSGGGTGFDGRLGNATLHIESDTAYLYFGFENLGIHVNGDQYLVYLHTRPGGYQPDGVQMDDGVASNPGDAGRRNSSILSTGGVERVLFLDEGVTNAPDFALVFNNRLPGSGGFVALFELRPAGEAHLYRDVTAAGLNTATVEFEIPLHILGMAPGDAVDVAAYQISDTGFLSGEGIPDLGQGNDNYEFNTGNTTEFEDFHRFLTIPEPAGLHRLANPRFALPLATPPPDTFAFDTEVAIDLPINLPMAVATPPGETNQLFVLERGGMVVAITNLASPTRTEFLSLAGRVNTSSEGGMLGLAFHPDYASNGHFFVFYTLTTNNGTGSGFHTRVSRFTRSATNAFFASPATEAVLFSQFNQAANHNAGDLHFGPDGYLYIATGDEGFGNDSLNNSQWVDKDFFSAILRVDVDAGPGSLAPNPHPAILGPVTNYAIPPDNPYIGITNFYGSNVAPSKVRTEFYATGLRNPFRFTFDPLTGELLCADVGQTLWEEVNLITNGGNYGWAHREGFISGPRFTTNPPSVYDNPLLVYGHGNATNQGFSITGGIVYRGANLPELYGHYLFADYVSGHIWSMTHDGITNTGFGYLTTDNNLVGFGHDPRNGDILMCDLIEGRIKRLVRTVVSTNPIPGNLSETGVFVDTANLTPNPGVVGYDLNLPFWSDNAIKTRWFSLPDTNGMIDFRPEDPWSFPSGMVWIKHFELELTNGVPASRRRIETRILVKNDEPAGGYGVTFRWGTSTDDAVLVQADGLNEPILIDDGGTIRTQVWRYPSRGECLSCHQIGAGFALGFNTPQLNRMRDYNGLWSNQISALGCSGYMTQCVENVEHLRALAHATNTEYSLEYRVRSYLQANCANCHFPGGPIPGNFSARIQESLSAANLIDGALNDDLSDHANRVVVRGSLPHSMLHTRIATLDPDWRMPPLASTVLDTQNIALVAAWIQTEATNFLYYHEWASNFFGSATNALAQRGVDADGDGNDNLLEFLSRTSPTNPLAFWPGPAAALTGASPVISFTRPARVGAVLEASPSLSDPEWQPVDGPVNVPVFTTDEAGVNHLPPAGTNLTLYHRVRLYEP